jgi:hypothetical protein
MTARDDRTQASAILLDLRERGRNWLHRCRWEQALEEITDEKTLEWGRRWNPAVEFSKAYVDLMFAFGLARIGARVAADGLVGEARAVLKPQGEAHSFLFDAYAYRIRQALEGRPHSGPLSDGLRKRLRGLVEERRLSRDVMGIGVPYVIDRLRACSRILEPDHRISPYRNAVPFMRKELQAAYELDVITDVDELATSVRQLLDRAARRRNESLDILAMCVEAAARAGRTFALEVLRRLPQLYDPLPKPDDHVALAEHSRVLEKGIHLAFSCAQEEQLQTLLEWVTVLFHCPAASRFPQGLALLLDECVVALRAPCRREALRRVLETLPQRVREAHLPEGAPAVRDWPVLLGAARGWLYVGDEARAMPLLNAARSLLLRPLRPPLGEGRRAGEEVFARADIACAYARAVGGLPLQRLGESLAELFNGLPPLPDRFTTCTHYSLIGLHIVEAAAWAVVDRETLDTSAPSA